MRHDHRLALLGISTLILIQAPVVVAVEPAAEPSHQVIACYFHRTERCATCKKVGAYVEEAIQDGFGPQLQAGAVKIRMIDFQDAKNQAFAQAYRITGPTLVLLDVHDGKVTSWKPAAKVWTLVADKDQFVRYVCSEVESYLSTK